MTETEGFTKSLHEKWLKANIFSNICKMLSSYLFVVLLYVVYRKFSDVICSAINTVSGGFIRTGEITQDGAETVVFGAPNLNIDATTLAFIFMVAGVIIVVVSTALAIYRFIYLTRNYKEMERGE